MNQRVVVCVLAMSALIALAGCQRAGPFDDWIKRDAALAQATREVLTEGAEASPARLGHATEPVPGEDAGPEAYVHLALERNPGLRAARQKIERLSERIAQVTTLDDPLFQVSPVGEMAETAAGQVGLMTGISQKLPFPGKLAARGRIAAQEVAVAAAELEQAKLKVAGDVRRAYWSYYFATRALEITRASRALLAQIKEAAESQLRAGRATQADVLRAETEISDLDQELVIHAQRRDTAVAMLNMLLDRAVAAPLPPPKKIVLAERVMELEQLLLKASATNPEIAAIKARIEQFRQRHALAELNYWPDLTVGLFYAAVDDDGLAMSANGDDQWWLTFGINLPIWREPREAARREAMRGIGENLGRLNDTHNRIAFRVRDALARVEAQQKVVRLFREQIIPQARQTVAVSRSAYAAGRTDFLDLIDNWRKLLNFELMQEQNLAEFERGLADLEEAVGGELPENGDQNPEVGDQNSPTASRTTHAPLRSGAGANVPAALATEPVTETPSPQSPLDAGE